MMVVGIGASAGGLEALILFVAQLSPDNGMSYVIVQHMPQHHRSLLVELLSHETALPVRAVRDGEKPVENTLYVAPGHALLSIDQGFFKLNPLDPATIANAGIDYFFSRLALFYQDLALGIIFSGSGHDGAEGLNAIKAAGGITIVQRPDSAKFDSMPKAAIAQVEVDFILEPEAAALQLTRLAKKLKQAEAKGADTEKTVELKPLFEAIVKTTGMDFSDYKISTLTRQMRRRMAVLQIETIDDYICHIDENPQELTQLAHKFLLGVTSFFRDDQAFNALQRVLQDIFNTKKTGDEIRIWVPGCATGEEAYSIAIMLAEILGQEINRYRLQIYGTDINTDAIHSARQGIYSENSLAGLDKHLRAKYFTAQDRAYSVNKQLRALVVFSRQDLIRNPPFIRLDLISCRNLLIYLNQDLQERVLKIFHYALQNQGVLFLGQSESLWSLSDAFTAVDRNSKLFIKNNSRFIRPDLNSQKMTYFNVGRVENTAASIHSTHKALGQNALITLFAPPSILATPEGQILELYKNCDAFLGIKQGAADFNLFALIDPALRVELKAFCHHAAISKKTVISPPLALTVESSSQCCRMQVTPVYPYPQRGDVLLLISFETVTQTIGSADFKDEDCLHFTDLEHELKTAREALQTVTQALEASVSDWQTLNEEAQTYNEELETSNEELQSINEELNLVNDELNLKTRELEALSDDLTNVLDSMETAVLVVDRHMHISRSNEVSNTLFKSGGKAAIPSLKALEALFDGADITAFSQQVIASGQSLHYKLSRQDRFFDLTIYPYRNRQADTCTGAVLTFEDITGQYLKEQEIQLAASVFDAANEAIVITDENNRILSVNPAFSQITGYSPKEVFGKNPNILSSGRQNQKFYQKLWESLKTTGKWQGEIWNRRKNGEDYIEWLSIGVFKDANGKSIRHVGIFTDISEIFKAQQTIMRQANYDALTKLPNRNLLYDRLQQAMTKARREHKLIGLLFIDLDGFKEINDAFGHSQGDLVLRHVTERMSEVMRESDTIARFGGDEFIVILSDMESADDLIPTTEKILQVVQKPISLDGHELSVTVSIGITLFPDDGNDMEVLLKHADNAMYAAKAQGRNGYRFFTQAMHEQVKRQHYIGNDIKQAVKQQQFSVFYQPVYDLGWQRIVGAEALIRWQHPIEGFIAPDQFIPIAEHLNLISEIGEFVLERACRFMAGINTSLKLPLSIAINFSSLQFGVEQNADKWLDIMKASGIDLNLVVVEITESLMMRHEDQYVRQLHLLRREGVQIALDDFGTGFSSLSYLKNLPFDILKIDQSFIRDILVDSSNASLVESILAIAKNFSLAVIAEGVEEKSQADFLIARHCQMAQGYYYGKPVPEAQFKQLVQAHG
ncbi:MAG: chemotaxis protein CheR [Gammaproteobacteria bacterium HGW-Gammaproteobacteria-3]|nr:MAG: chemotaxis protein CheR [Gammaproteobacteria bacterium HGW-Gammaproteobacteria-3]